MVMRFVMLSLLTACGASAPPPTTMSAPISQPHEWPSQLPPNYAELRGVSRFATPTQDQARACSAGAMAFFVFEQSGRTLDAPVCSYSVSITRDCGVGGCAATLTSADGRETWSGPCRSAKAGDFAFDVTSNSGARGTFFYDLPRGEGALTVGERRSAGRVILP